MSEIYNLDIDSNVSINTIEEENNDYRWDYRLYMYIRRLYKNIREYKVDWEINITYFIILSTYILIMCKMGYIGILFIDKESFGSLISMGAVITICLNDHFMYYINIFLIGFLVPWMYLVLNRANNVNEHGLLAISVILMYLINSIKNIVYTALEYNLFNNNASIYTITLLVWVALISFIDIVLFISRTKNISCKITAAVQTVMFIPLLYFWKHSKGELIAIVCIKHLVFLVLYADPIKSQKNMFISVILLVIAEMLVFIILEIYLFYRNNQVNYLTGAITGAINGAYRMFESITQWRMN